MKTNTISLALVISFLLAACGATPSWQTFTSDKGKFTVEMPATPKESTQSVDTALGKIELTLYTAQVGTSAYLATFSDYPDVMSKADPAKVLDGAMNGAVTNVSGKILSSSDITINGNPGKEFSAEGKITNPGDGSVRGRIYLVKTRLYQLIVVGLKDQIPTADADRYLQSFKLN